MAGSISELDGSDANRRTARLTPTTIHRAKVRCRVDIHGHFAVDVDGGQRATATARTSSSPDITAKYLPVVKRPRNRTAPKCHAAPRYRALTMTSRWHANNEKLQRSPASG